MIRRQLMRAFLMTVLLIVLLGVLYPLIITGIAEATMPRQANGSLLTVAGKEVGSKLLAQAFTAADGAPLRQYFQPRPSATATSPYNAMASGGSNLGPSNPQLLELVRQRVAAYRNLNGLAAGAPVPVDAVTSSASGLDPDISVANA
jgi:K+-transporting ATPase ATPase C chain